MMRHLALARPPVQGRTKSADEPLDAETGKPDRRRGARSGRGPVKILFFAANASSGEQLALDEEYRSIERAIRRGRYRDRFQLIPKLAARRSDLQEALLEHAPDVVHFACHGSAQSALLLESELGSAAGANPASISSSALASLFGVLRDNLVLVVFNACFAADQAKAIRQHAGLAIGMRARIEDQTAIAFASALYGALAFGRSVGDAFDLGVAAVEAEAPQQKHLPRLFADAGIEARQVCLASQARRHPARWLLAVPAMGSLLLLAAPALRPPQHGADQSSRGMIRFAATSTRPGVFAAELRPAQCSALTAREDCAELQHPELVGVVQVAPFDLDILEVTNGEFAAWLNANTELWQLAPYGVVVTRQEPARPLLRTEKCGGALTISPDNRAQVLAEAVHWPVVCVSWDGAREYCRAQGKRLPLDVEWELAAKGATGRPFPWGTDLPRQDGVSFERRSGLSVHPRAVGDSPQDISPDGIHDLGGNVAEWVDDRRDNASEKTLRGGSFASLGPCHLLGSGCSRISPDKYQKDIGFRCARNAAGERGGADDAI